MTYYEYHCPKCGGGENVDYGQAAQHLCPQTGKWESLERKELSKEEAERKLVTLLNRDRVTAGLKPLAEKKARKFWGFKNNEKR